MAHEAKYRMTTLADRLIVGLPAPLSLPVEIHRHVRTFDQDPVDSHVELNAIIDRKVAFDLQLEPTQTVEGHQQGLKSGSVFRHIGLADPLDGRVDASHLCGIRRVHSVGFAAGEIGGSQKTDKSPEQESPQERLKVTDHAAQL